MNLPPYYFPVRVCPHHGEDGDKKMNFADYGSCSNVNECEDTDEGSNMCLPQKGHGRLDGLDKVLPMLPLNDRLTMKDCQRNRDMIVGFDNFANLFKTLEGFFTTLHLSEQKFSGRGKDDQLLANQCKAELHRLLEKYESQENSTSHKLNDDHSLGESLESLKRNMPNFMRRLYQHYSWLQKAHNESCFKGFNGDFYKGLLCSLTVDDQSSSILFHAGGKKFRDLYMTKVSRDVKTDLQKGEKVTKLSLKKPVYQVSSSKKGVVCVRHKKECSVLVHDVCQLTLRIGNSMTSNKDDFTDVSPSPFLANEILLSEKSGVVTLWNFNTNNCHHLVKRQRLEFESSTNWTGSYFAGHPRQIVIADCASVELFDHRNSFQRGSELFNLSPSLVKGNEQIMSAIPLDFPYHAIGTDTTIFMMDQRFPGSPVLQWHLERMSNPQMLHFAKFNTSLYDLNSNAIIFVATQQPAEVLCLPVSYSEVLTPRSLILPWQVGKSREIFEEESHSMGIEWCDVEKRFQMSMAGMTVVNESVLEQEAFSIYQMDAFGDLFYQQFKFVEKTDKGHFQLKEPLCKSQEAARQRVHECMSNLNSHETQFVPEAHHREDKSSSPLKFSDVRGLFKALDRNEEDISEDFLSHFSPRGTDIKTWSSLCCSGINTQLHIALKDGEDVTQLLEARENDHEKKKRTMQLKACKKSSRVKSREIIESDEFDSDSDLDCSERNEDSMEGLPLLRVSNA